MNDELMLNKMSLSQIYELLMEHTHHYTRMMNSGVRDKEFKECEWLILRLQKEINERQEMLEQ